MSVTSPARRPRRLSLLTVGCLILTLIGSMTVPRPAVARSQPGSTDPIDLAALQPGVVDLEDAGVDGLVPSSINDADTLRQYLGFQTFPDDDAYQDQYDTLDAAGFVRNFQTWWADEAAILANGAGDGFAPETQVRFYATQFADAGGAADAFDANESGDTDIDGADIDLGDATDVSEASTADSGVALDGVDVTVRVGALNVGVLVWTRAGSPIRGDELPIATDLIGSYIDRIGAFDRGELPTDTIGLDPVRFVGASLYTGVDGYLVRDGEPVWADTGTSPREREDVTGNLVDAGVTDQYEIRQILVTEEFAGEAFGYIIDSLVTSYETEDQARDTFATARDGWKAIGYDVAALDGAPEAGDESIAFRAVDAGGNDFVSIMTWRDGATIHRAYINLPVRLAEPDALFALVDAQVGCLGGGTCWRNQGLPDEIAADAGPVADASARPSGGTPGADDETGTPVADDGGATPESTGDQASYQSADLGFSLAWDETVWAEVADYEPFFGVEGLRLDHADGGTLFIEVQDSRPARTVAGCVANLSDIVLSEGGVNDVEPAVNADGGEIAGESDGVAFAAYAITFGGDDGLDYFACATLVDGESAVGFIYITSALDTVERQLADVEAIIASYDAG